MRSVCVCEHAHTHIHRDVAVGWPANARATLDRDPGTLGRIYFSDRPHTGGGGGGLRPIIALPFSLSLRTSLIYTYVRTCRGVARAARKNLLTSRRGIHVYIYMISLTPRARWRSYRRERERERERVRYQPGCDSESRYIRAWCSMWCFFGRGSGLSSDVIGVYVATRGIEQLVVSLCISRGVFFLDSERGHTFIG